MTARVLVVGAGGLGGPIALVLGEAGCALVIVDPDVVELSNLHRQIQFSDVDLGAAKASSLALTVEANGGRARGIVDRFTADNAAALAGDAAVIVDASDDPATKFAVADWARLNRRACVIAAAVRYGGNVFAGAPGSACYRCLFEDAPDEVATCGDSGVLGPVVGWVGGVAAIAAVRLAAGDRSAAGTIWILDDLRRGGARVLALARRAGCVCEGAP